MNILGLCGSIRKGSLNRKLLRAAESTLPEGVTLTRIHCGDLPLYSEDIDGASKPSAVQQLLASIQQSDALLIATP